MAIFYHIRPVVFDRYNVVLLPDSSALFQVPFLRMSVFVFVYWDVGGALVRFRNFSNFVFKMEGMDAYVHLRGFESDAW